MANRSFVKFPLNAKEIAVALTCGSLRQGHVGIAFVNENDVPVVFHLAWHRNVKLEPLANPGGCWLLAKLDLSEDAAESLGVYVESVAGNTEALCQVIDYGTDFLASVGSFLPDGQYERPAHSIGLTCASFVIEVLRAGQLTLIDEQSWQPSPANNQWIEQVAEFLQRDPARAAQAQAVRGRLNGLRLMPVEVAGSATTPAPNWPINFQDAQGLADTARAVLTEECAC